MKRIQALFMTGSIPLLYLHYPNDLMGTRPWQTGKSAARCWQAAPARQTGAPVPREERYNFILILNHHLHKHIVTIIVLLLLVAALHSALGTWICPDTQQTQSVTWWNVCNFLRFSPHKTPGWYQSSKQHWESTCFHTHSYSLSRSEALQDMELKTAKIHTDPNSQTITKEALFTVPTGYRTGDSAALKHCITAISWCTSLILVCAWHAMK